MRGHYGKLMEKAKAFANTDSILIQGESGTGKELIAGLFILYQGARSPCTY